MRTDRYKEEPKKDKRRTLRVLLVLILVLIAGISTALAYMYKSARDSIEIEFTAEKPEVEFSEEHSSMDYVKDAEGKVSPSRKYLDTSKLGARKITYTVTKPVLGGLLRPSKKFTWNYEVVDMTPPLVLWNGDGSVLTVGEEFDINKYIGYGDNADPAPRMECVGDVDTSTPGDYPLKITIIDASGNSTRCDMKITVAEELPEYESGGGKIKFAKFRKKYAGEGRHFGIDVSAWQDEIDFEAVKKAGCEFVMIRIGYSSGDGTVATPDNRFSENIKKAKAAGLKVGVYLYSYDKNENMVRGTADWVIRKLAKEKLDLPVAFDWEEFGQFQTYGISFRDLNDMYDAFADELSKGGYDCMLYGSARFLDLVWEDTDVRPVWLAHYTEQTDYEGPYMIWQVANTGRIKGISGDVDLDILYD